MTWFIYDLDVFAGAWTNSSWNLYLLASSSLARSMACKSFWCVPAGYGISLEWRQDFITPPALMGLEFYKVNSMPGFLILAACMSAKDILVANFLLANNPKHSLRLPNVAVGVLSDRRWKLSGSSSRGGHLEHIGFSLRPIWGKVTVEYHSAVKFSFVLDIYPIRKGQAGGCSYRLGKFSENEFGKIQIWILSKISHNQQNSRC